MAARRFPLEGLVEEYIRPTRSYPIKMLYVEAGSSLRDGEPRVGLFVPRCFLRRYNLRTVGVETERLPRLGELWGFLKAGLAGRKTGLAEDTGLSTYNDLIGMIDQWPVVFFRVESSGRGGYALEISIMIPSKNDLCEVSDIDSERNLFNEDGGWQ